MTIQDIIARINKRLNIASLLPMQQAMADISLPAKTLLCAPTGSGKTLAFSIPLLRSLPLKAGDGVNALVIAPTRELVLQIYDIIRVLAAPDFKATAVYGGHSFSEEAKSLEGGPDIVIGTPGRILDHLKRGRLNLLDTRTLVIDEYDKALELGFADDMHSIVGRLKKADTLILTSATKGELPDFISGIEHSLDYTGSTAKAPVPEIDVYKIDSASPDKLGTLEMLLRSLANVKTMVFVNHRDAAERVYRHLQKEQFPAILYHGGLDQQLRERALILFENGTCPILVSTDLAARGLDIDNVGAVIHYHLPVNEEAWTHRNGRTARMGKNGQAFVIVSDHDKVPVYMNSLLSGEIPHSTADVTATSSVATLYLNAGKKEKISKGDIAGFLIQKGGLDASEIGRIDVKDHCAYVAVPADKARSTAAAVAPYKIKNTRVRVTQLKNIH